MFGGFVDDGIVRSTVIVLASRMRSQMRRNMWARAVFHHHKSLRIILYANAAVWCILIVDTLLNAAEL